MNRRTRGARERLLAAIAAGWLIAAPALACDFDAVKKQIDTVLDRDKNKAAEFRRMVAEGYDSIEALNRLVPADMRDKIDVCRFQVTEYLTRRGFPPAH